MEQSSILKAARWFHAVRSIAGLSTLLGLAGCQSWILKPDTVDMSGSVGPIYMDQALDNLAKAAVDPTWMPSQIDINTGTVTLSSGLNPTLTLPLGSQVASGATGSVTTITTPYRSLGLGASITRGGTWSVAAVSDPSRLQNLAALYRFVLDGDTGELKANYHLPIKIANNSMGVDPNYVVGPQCVFCLPISVIQDAMAKPQSTIHDVNSISEKFVMDNGALNPALHGGGWILHSDQDVAPVTDARPLGQHQGVYLWLRPVGDDKGKNMVHYMSDLLTFLLPPAAAPAPSPASNAAAPAGKSGT